jgi:hypothetical protein
VIEAGIESKNAEEIDGSCLQPVGILQGVVETSGMNSGASKPYRFGVHTEPYFFISFSP